MPKKPGHAQRLYYHKRLPKRTKAIGNLGRWTERFFYVLMSYVFSIFADLPPREDQECFKEDLFIAPFRLRGDRVARDWGHKNSPMM